MLSLYSIFQPPKRWLNCDAQIYSLSTTSLFQTFSSFSCKILWSSLSKPPLILHTLTLFHIFSRNLSYSDKKNNRKSRKIILHSSMQKYFGIKFFLYFFHKKKLTSCLHCTLHNFIFLFPVYCIQIYQTKCVDYANRLL